MRINRSTSLMLSAAVALAIAAPAAAGGPHPAPGAQNDDVTVDCNDQGDTIGLNGPTLIWPPNHKMVDLTITMTDADGGQSSFATTSTHDEYLEDGTEMNGSGNTTEDWADIEAASGSPAVGTLQVRAERSGRGDGREYTVDVVGQAGGDDCRATFTLLVPHDMRPDNRVKPDNDPES